MMSFKNLYKDIKCAIFDLDGTLIKSIGAWRDVDIKFMEKRNLPIPEDFYEKVKVMNFPQAADYVINECGVTDTKEAVMEEWLTMIQHEYAEVVDMVEGAKQFLQRLHQNGVKIALATASREELYKPCLERHGVYDLFDAFVTTDEVARKKGFPDVYLLAAERCGAKPEECAVFEDIYLGCVGAKAGNMYTIGILEEHSKPDWDKIKETADETWTDYRHLL